MPEFEVERGLEINQLKRRLEDIRGTFYGQRQPIGGIEAVVTGAGKGPERMPAAGWKPFQVLGSWGGFDQTTWFRMTVTIPETMKGKRVVALIRVASGTFTPGVEALSAAGEALVYLNGKPWQGLDLNRDEVLLAEKAKGGETFDLAIEAVPSTRFDARHIFQFADLAVFHPEAWEFYWDATVALEVVETLEVESVQRRRLLQLVNNAVQRVDLQHIGEPAYFESLDSASRFLRKGLRAFDDNFGMGRLVLAGHAHIDTAWLWPLRETRRKCGRTFSNVLGLMERYPEFHFSCSQPAQYEWIKTHYPELFERIRQRVKEGRWELFGGAWIEPDHNVPSGESLIRQYLYGNRWFEKEFGKRSHFAWVPDSFGYTWSLPQILAKCQIKAFLTTKITWSMFTKFPYSYFQWEGTDGTRIPALMPPLNYNGNPLPKNCIDQWKLFKEKKHVEELPFAFGWGDGGGGPTSAMIEHGRRLENMTGVPKCSFGRMSDSVSRMLEQSEASQLPVYNDELYLELHRACQITHARTKRNNRLCEKNLHDAEFLSSLALLNGGVYDDAALLDAWKIVLTNQFHDILPGSSITEVYTQADKDYAEAKTRIAGVQDSALAYLLEQINTTGEGQTIVVFNSLSWVRSELVRVQLEPHPDHFSILDPNGNPVAYQQTGANEILFEAAGMPPLGYAAYRLVSGAQIAETTGMLKVSEKGMENPYIRLRFDKTGALSSVYDKVEARDVLSKGARGNVLQLFDDRPFDHDAWDIDHNFEEKTWEPGFMGAEVIETGPLRGVVRLTWKTERSTFTQDVTIYADSPRVEFVTHVDWWEKRTLLKVAFPVDIRATRAAAEIQYGVIERPTHRNTAYDRGRFEASCQRWIDLSEGNYGVSLLNDSKYSYDAHGNVLRLSLLRSPVDPDPHADEGEHQFTYALYPHSGDWRQGAVHQGLELNYPLVARVAGTKTGPLPSVHAFAQVDVENVIVDAVKRHEDSNAFIVRLYEAYGQRGAVNLSFGRVPKGVVECDCMEENDAPVRLNGDTVMFEINPFELRTFKVEF